MSFRDVGKPPVAPVTVTPPQKTKTTSSYSVPMDMSPPEYPSASLVPAKKTRPIVLHGKVLNVIDSEAMETHKVHARLRMDRSARQEETVRQSFERRSTFSQLSHETQQFQKLVTDLEGNLQQSAESPEASWRGRILIRSAQEAEKDLWNKLYNYEKTLLAPTVNKQGVVGRDKENSQKEFRSAQSACMKLHRDFNRSHKALVMALSLHEKRQKAEVSRLHAVAWSEKKDKDEDFFDKAMREREAELERMNKSMHTVNAIYGELAALVDGQQGDVDALDDGVSDAKANVDAGMDEINCLFDREQFCGAMSFGGLEYDGDKEERTVTTSATANTDTNAVVSPLQIKPGESFDWFSPFETMGEDMSAVHRDIVGFGKDILTKGQNYGLSESSRS